MTRRTLRALGAAAAIGILALTGCTPTGQQTQNTSGEDTSLYEQTIVLEDGREVTCIVYRSGYRGGLSCDWDGAQ